MLKKVQAVPIGSHYAKHLPGLQVTAEEHRIEDRAAVRHHGDLLLGKGREPFHEVDRFLEIRQRLALGIEEIESFLAQQDVEMGTVQGHEALTVVLHQFLAGLLETLPSGHVGRLDAVFLEKVLSIIQHHGAERLRNAKRFPSKSENLEATRVNILNQSGFLHAIREVDEGASFAEKDTEEGLVELYQIRNALARHERGGQLVWHFTEPVGVHVYLQVVLGLVPIQLGHLLVVDLVLKGADPHLQGFGASRNQRRKKEETEKDSLGRKHGNLG